MKTFSVIVAPLVLWAGIVSAQNITNVSVTVKGTAGPWEWVNGGLNTAYQYGIGFPGFTAPSVISATNGLRFSVGDSLTIGYVSGSVAGGPSGWPFVDANGDTNAPMNNGYIGHGPSYYMNPATYPIYVTELVGTFANSSGQIVGTPFAIGDLATVTVPAGATQLQLGVNDNLLSDNPGSWNIQVTGPTVTTPSTCPNLVGTWSGQVNVADAWRGYSTTTLSIQVTDQSTNGCLIRGHLTMGNVSNRFPNIRLGWNPWFRVAFTGTIPDGTTVLLNVGGEGPGKASASLDMSQTPPVLTEFVYQPGNGDTVVGNLTKQPSSP